MILNIHTHAPKLRFSILRIDVSHPSHLHSYPIYMIFTDNMSDYVRQLQRFNVGEDCPVFDGLFEFCQIYTSGSIGMVKKYWEFLF